MITLLKFFDQCGRDTLLKAKSFLSFIEFIYLTFRCLFFIPSTGYRTIFENVISQIYFTGVGAIPLITFVALACGALVILQFTQLSIFSSQEMLGSIMVTTIIREIGPLLTSLIIIARSGTAVASEVGSMQVNKELLTLRTMGIEPYAFLIFPRVFSGVMSMLALAFYFNFIAFFGGYLVSYFISNYSLDYYIEILAFALTPTDFLLNLFKNAFGGLLIFSIASFEGQKIHKSSHEIPIATTQAVVKSVMAIMTFNLVVSSLTFMRSL